MTLIAFSNAFASVLEKKTLAKFLHSSFKRLETMSIYNHFSLTICDLGNAVTFLNDLTRKYRLN